MNNQLPKFLLFLVLSELLDHVSSEPSKTERYSRYIGCQQKSSSGLDYEGEANTTVNGIPCQRWSERQPHDHSFTRLGNHNFCRNPDNGYSGVWCLTSDPDVEWEYCSVPFCPTLKAVDFSLNNDGKPDQDNIYTHA